MNLKKAWPQSLLLALFVSITYFGNAQSPNVVLILADDLGYNDVSFNGSKEIPTPNIDKIAEQGVRFTNAYVSYAVCGPSRAGLITGRFQDRFGFGLNPLYAPKDPQMGLPLSEETLASALLKADYKSAALGKWHLGAHESLHPLKRGFTDFYGFLTGGHFYFPEDLTIQDQKGVKSQYDAYREKILRNYERVEETEYLTDGLSREAVNYIEKYKDDPFFIYLAYNAPHTPMQATEKYLSRFGHIEDKKRRTYAAMVSAVDDGVGRVLDKLEELGLDENTIVIFLSDNGGPEPHNGSDNGALKGGKGELYEGGIRVPFAMKWPKEIPQGIVYEKPIISLDIFSTVVEQSNIKTKNKLDGINLIPYLKGEKEAEERVFFWRQTKKERSAVRFGDYKYLNLEKSNEKMLFDVNKDISETTNLKDSKANIYKELEEKYNTLNKEMKDPVFMGLTDGKEYNALHPDRFE
ncbi:sulfatase-like hydrolase/transferase [Joostella atrarenae]|uniref:Sulfatase-like hydrolase/transferase n=1 Tax=Joostella atrarenae TaxID=679257 RepID=A0ABS9J5K5_9FLAO|nr:sulfatase-like hydrolase/transferase [Joostella atrarenae]MCF8715618.1 sulfatase-like hydrolase/transferase [Joostella atrarenae]